MADVGKDLRQHPRAEVELKVRVSQANIGEFVEAYTGNLSAGGMFLKMYIPYAVGTPVHFEILLKDSQPVLRGRGVVCWVRPAAAGASPAGVGIKFEELDPASRELVRQIMEQHNAAPPAAKKASAAPAAVRRLQDQSEILASKVDLDAEPGQPARPKAPAAPARFQDKSEALARQVDLDDAGGPQKQPPPKEQPATGGPERRQHRRVSLGMTVRAKFKDVEDFVQGYTLNLSAGGLFIRTKFPQPVGTPLDFDVKLEEENLTFHGQAEVTRCIPVAQPGERPRIPGMGVRFKELDGATQEMIKSLVDIHRAPPPGEEVELDIPLDVVAPDEEVQEEQPPEVAPQEVAPPVPPPPVEKVQPVPLPPPEPAAAVAPAAPPVPTLRREAATVPAVAQAKPAEARPAAPVAAPARAVIRVPAVLGRSAGLQGPALKKLVIDSLVTSLDLAKTPGFGDDETTRYLLDSWYGDYFRDGVVDLTLLWNTLLAEEGMNLEIAAVPLVIFQLAKPVHGLAVSLPEGLREHAGLRKIKSTAAERILAGGGFAKALQNVERRPKAVVPVEKVEKLAVKAEPKEKEKEAKKFGPKAARAPVTRRRKLITIAAMLIGIGLGTWGWISVFPSRAMPFDTHRLSSVLRLTDAATKGKSFFATIDDPAWEMMSLEERHQVVGRLLDNLRDDGVNSLTLYDQEHIPAALARVVKGNDAQVKIDNELADDQKKR